MRGRKASRRRHKGRFPQPRGMERDGFHPEELKPTLGAAAQRAAFLGRHLSRTSVDLQVEGKIHVRTVGHLSRALTNTGIKQKVSNHQQRQVLSGPIHPLRFSLVPLSITSPNSASAPKQSFGFLLLPFGNESDSSTVW